ncbi:hypothetical protein C8R45DRAFT_1100281 [Mycena sanguinolenta]|nr:hypothetical protein C8R45DRAFT_1100281 [Mycena sanguinolenta]
MMITGARDATTSTPELLELILAHLPMRDLLVTAPLVSKTLVKSFICTHTESAPGGVVSPLFHLSGSRQGLLDTAKAIKSMPWVKSSDAFKRAEASWRRMLVTQLPALKMIVTETWYGKSSTAERRTAMADISPLRMGSLYDIALPFADADMDSSFCVLWCNNSEDELILAVIYDIALSFADADMDSSFCVLWRNSSEGELILALTFTESTRRGRGLQLDETFYSDAFRVHPDLEREKWTIHWIA